MSMGRSIAISKVPGSAARASFAVGNGPDGRPAADDHVAKYFIIVPTSSSEFFVKVPSEKNGPAMCLTAGRR
eukprot:CAMPEP_0119514868 /NCGR_PEP_ID=MMETSP1344-20130328/32557_1 /TAXON_ID=236787 /ORGANISM="Florenciella parvula, Strain CCMP2471" /LENGTH=71 /DNA_ID=CAMNT_0007552225 /DNA_START=164 /DNA_END=376 /DNA_ORIENTATION=-